MTVNACKNRQPASQADMHAWIHIRYDVSRLRDSFGTFTSAIEGSGFLTAGGRGDLIGKL